MKILHLSVAGMVLMGCASHNISQDSEKPSIILFIGDGMGISQVTFGRIGKLGLDGSLAMDKLPITGFVKTHSGNAIVTDSAAAASTYATGQKYENFAINWKSGKACRAYTYELKSQGYAIGIVTTAKITHATPAGFYGVADSRAKESEIVKQVEPTGFDLFLGGGKKYFTDEILAGLKKAGYRIFTKADELKREIGNPQPAKVIGLFNDDHINYVLDRTPDEPDLETMTKYAIRFLAATGKPYFLMVEGGRIDMACHVSDARSEVEELADFDKAIETATLEARQKTTTILVTADHATGGLAITDGFQQKGSILLKQKASVEKIAAEVKDEDTAKSLIEKYGGFMVSDAEAKEIGGTKDYYDRATLIGQAISFRGGISFVPLSFRKSFKDVTHGHDGGMVPLYAWGNRSELFSGTHDNTEIQALIQKIIDSK